MTRIDLFTVRPATVPVTLTRMATDRLRLRRQPGLLFRKLLGTGDGRTFDVRDADLLRWGCCGVRASRWPHCAAGPLGDRDWWATLAPLRMTGSWSGRQPFG